MCGIAGFVGAADGELLSKMTDALAHRGPDGRGVWLGADGEAHLGHRRLAIVDLESGAQPMWTADGALGITFNGEIYNHVELRDELRRLGHRFVTDHSDTEVLLHGYRQWGEALLDRLNGMWSFVIYDRARRSLFGARDRFGKKPLYYAVFPQGFAFASELTSLAMHPRVDTSISRAALRKYYGYGYVPAPWTIYEGARKLPGGHYFRYGLDDSTLDVRRYWEFVLEPDFSLLDIGDDALGERVLSALDAAVERRLMADVPLGCFLSGGIDSTAVAYLAARHLGASHTRTFSIGFTDPAFDESRHAAFAAAFVGTPHHLQMLDVEKGKVLLPEILDKLDEPMGDASILPTFQLCKHTREHVTVALGGDGADELFAGYDPFRAIAMAKFYNTIVPRPVHRAIRYVAARLPVSHGYMSFDFRIKRTLRGLAHRSSLWAPVWMASLEPNELERLFGERIHLEEVFSEAIDAWDASPTENEIDRLLVYYTKLYLQDDILTKVDRASMAVSLEVRSPFLDKDFVDLVRTIPSSRKLRRGKTKWILRTALGRTLPPQILQRSKRGFGVPIGRWFKDGELRVDGRTASRLGLSAAFIGGIQQDHVQERADQRAFLWNQWILESWLRHREPPTSDSLAA